MAKLTDSIKLKNKTVKNRLVMPPAVCFNWADTKGYETVSRAQHYGDRAKGGTGLIVIEATAILPEARIVERELGLWEDGHMAQFSKIAAACHEHGSVVLVQLVHAGQKSFGEVVKSSSAREIQGKTCEALTLEEIGHVKDAFVSAAVRAEKAGLDGIEIHGAHGYLLSQFTASKTNFRTDAYGGSLENRTRLSVEIVKAIRESTSDEFIIGYRFGVNDPLMKEDIWFARELEALGVDFFNVSSGIGMEGLEVPKDFPFSPITHMGTVIHKQLKTPVACVFGIRTPEDANYLIENNLTDFVAIGRGLLAEPNWFNKAASGIMPNICYDCKSGCKYRIDGKTCPLYGK